jgi:hypothetical protein
VAASFYAAVAELRRPDDCRLVRLPSPPGAPGSVTSHVTPSHATRPIDLIMASGSRSLRVALHNRTDLFSNAPVVFMSVDPKAAADLRLDADVTGTWVHMGWTETLDLARRLQPDIVCNARRLVPVQRGLLPLIPGMRLAEEVEVNLALLRHRIASRPWQDLKVAASTG